MRYSAKELQAVLLSRELRDGECGAAGAVAAIPMAAMLLARQLHAPSLQIAGEMFVNPRPRRLWESMLDDRALGTCEAPETFVELFGHAHRGLDFFFHSGLQHDQYGNVNLHYIGSPEHPTMRGPGAANVSYGVTSKRFYIVPATHTPRNFVSRVDFITIAGHLQGPASKAAAGLRREGPRLCITPLAVMDFEPRTLHMRVRSVHEGHSLAEVRAATGFELVVDGDVPMTDAPTERELDVLRTVVDRDGSLRR